MRLIVEDAGRRLLDLPYHHTDNTWRTHVGARINHGATRLVLFHTNPPERIMREVYAWNGSALEKTSWTLADRQLLDAFAADDDHGTLHAWLVWWLGSKLLVVIVGLPWVAAWMIHRFDFEKSSAPIPSPPQDSSG